MSSEAPDANGGDFIRVEVIDARPRAASQVVLQLPRGSTVAAALAASGLVTEDVVAFAVFGERAARDTVLRDGDRVELLRRLTIDPKEARRRRARK